MTGSGTVDASAYIRPMPRGPPPPEFAIARARREAEDDLVRLPSGASPSIAVTFPSVSAVFT